MQHLANSRGFPLRQSISLCSPISSGNLSHSSQLAHCCRCGVVLFYTKRLGGLRMDLRYCQICGNAIGQGAKNYDKRRFCASCKKNGAYTTYQRRLVNPPTERQKRCEYCGNVIPREHNRGWTTYSERKFCSYKCANASPHPRAIVACVSCGKTFDRHPSRVSKRNYCSQCWQTYRSIKSRK